MSLKIVTTSLMRAQAGVKQMSTTGQQKKKGSRVQTENKDHRDTKNASRRGGNKLPLAEARRKDKNVVSPSQDMVCLRIDSHLLDT